MYICIYIYIYVYIYIYIYIYIYVRELPHMCAARTHRAQARSPTDWHKDNGGPSKGCFLNNILFSYTDLDLCNEINGMCI